MFGSAPSFPVLSLADLNRNGLTKYLLEIDRLKVFFPTADYRLFLSEEVRLVVERHSGRTLDKLSQDDTVITLRELVAPKDHLEWLDELRDVRCASQVTTLTTRVQLMRDFVTRFMRLYEVRSTITFPGQEASLKASEPKTETLSSPSDDLASDEEAQDDDKPDDIEDKATMLFRNNVKPPALQKILKNEADMQGVDSLSEMSSLALKLAQQDEDARRLAIRFGYYTAKAPVPVKEPVQTTSSGNGRRRRGQTPGANRTSTDDTKKEKKSEDSFPEDDVTEVKPKVNDVDPSKPAPHRPCRICKGSHWDNQCPDRRSRDDGSLRSKPKKRQTNNVQEADESDDSGPLVVRGQVNGRDCSLIIDTGSDATCMSAATFNHLKMTANASLKEGEKYHGVCANGSEFTSTKYTEVEITLPAIVDFPVRLKTEVLVVPGTSHKILIGAPLLRRVGIITKDRMFLRFTQEKMERGSEDDIPAQVNAVTPVPRAEPFVLDEQLAKIRVPINSMRKDVEAIFRDHPEVLNPKLAEHGSKLPPLRIKLAQDNVLIQSKARRLDDNTRERVRAEVKAWREQGIIEDSRGPFASPIVVVEKGHKSGKIRLCVDYTHLNGIVVPDQHPLPDLREFLREAAGSTHFAALDLRSGYLQMTVHPKDQFITAAVTPDDYFQFKRVPFGLKTAPAAFQRAMQATLAPCLHKGVLVYVDDILIHAKSAKELLERVRQVVMLLEQKNIRISAEKCVIGAKEIQCVGFTVSEKGLTIGDERVRAMQELPAPTDVGGVRRILGKFNYLASFIPHCAEVLAPLNRMTQKGARFEWSNDLQAALDGAKSAVTDAVQLVFPDLNTPWHLYTDASDVGIGGVLIQRRGDKSEVVSFFSKTFSSAQKNWTTYEKELYAILFCLTRPDLEPLFRVHNNVTVHTDHRNITFLHQSSTSNAKIQRWRLILNDYNPTIYHIEGAQNVVADALSRLERQAPRPVNSVEDHRAALDEIHMGTRGHPKREEMMRELRQKGITWPTMSDDIARYIKSCTTCQKMGPTTLTKTPNQSTQRYSPFEVVQMDTLGPLPASGDMKYVIVFIDVFTKYTVLKPVSDTTAKNAARQIIDLCSTFGIPKTLQSDRGSQFKNALVKEVTDKLGTNHRFSTAYHPQSNGVVERANGTLLRILRSILFDRPDLDWLETLPTVQHIMNTRWKRATGHTPLELVTGGKTCATPMSDEALIHLATSHYSTMATYDLLDQVSALREDAEGRLRQASPPRTPNPLPAAGSFVLLTPVTKRPKTQTRLRGPMKVVGPGPSPNTINLSDLNTKSTIQVHTSRIKPFVTTLDEKALEIQVSREADRYAVDEIVDFKVFRAKNGTAKKIKFKVTWLGYEPSEASWIWYNKDNDELEAIDALLAQHPQFKADMDTVSRQWR